MQDTFQEELQGLMLQVLDQEEAPPRASQWFCNTYGVRVLRRRSSVLGAFMAVLRNGSPRKGPLTYGALPTLGRAGKTLQYSLL